MRNHRRAFTLFQLLLLLSILAILLGLLLAAVARVRAAAEHLSGSNNLKQIALAAHNYHDTHGKFPEGRDAKGFSVHAKLLPYLEQENLYRLIDFTTEPTAAANNVARSTILKVYLSPLDTVNLPVPMVAPTNYLFVAGAKPALEDNDGMFPTRAQRILDVFDGTSNTLVAVETLKGDGGRKAESVARQHVRLKKEDLKGLKDEAGVKDFKDNTNIASDRGAAWIEGRFLSALLSLNRLPNDEKPDVDCGGDGGLAGIRSEGRSHLVFGDGSVRTTTKKVNLDFWKALATRNGGEVVNTNEL